MNNNGGLNIITLNIWVGKMRQELADFIHQYQKITDVFCFQEVYTSYGEVCKEAPYNVRIFEELQQLLQETHIGYFHGAQEGFWAGKKTPANWGRVDFGVAMFIRKELEHDQPSNVFVHGRRNQYLRRQEHPTSFPRNMQIATITYQEQKHTVTNLHGFHKAGTWKKDTKERKRQSSLAVKALWQHENIIFCGDLNLHPESESLNMIKSGLGLVNLIAEHNITDTRTDEYRHRNTPGNTQNADYIFLSPDLKYTRFEVLPEVVSDHRALMVSIN